MSLYKNILSLLLISLVLQSCQEVIDIKLNDKDRQLVVEGGIVNMNLATIMLTTTVNFSDANDFPPVSTTVRISDNEGNSELLTEISPGKYINQSIIGKPGNTYTLTINYNEKEYVAVSTMPSPVESDTVTLEPGIFGNVFGNDSQLMVTFTDPAGLDNYYRLHVSKGDSFITTLVTDDRLQDGKQLKQGIFAGPGLFSKGDTVTIVLESIDRNTFEYYRTFQQVSSGGAASASPANPLNNISNNGLGYFSAHSATVKKFILP